MQELEYKNHSDYDKQYCYQKWKQIAYMSKQKFAANYPKYEGGYRIVGTIGKKTSKEIGRLNYNRETLPVHALAFQRFIYEIAGYIEVGEDTYVAIIKSKLQKNLCMGACILLLLIGGMIYLEQKEEVEIDAGAGKYEAPIELPEGSDPSHISIPGYTDIKMKAGSDTAYVALWNPDGNPCYFMFTMIDNETEEILYQSKMVPPGYAIREVKLNKSIERGIHPIRISISTYDLLDFKTQLNGGEVNANLIGILEN